MDRKRAMRNRALAGALTMALVSTGIVVVTDAITSPDPAIHVEGLELRMKTDPGTGKQSVQALVEISVTNQDFLQGVAMTLEYNKDYLEPSDWVTNVGYGESGVRWDGTTYEGNGLVTDPIDYTDPLHHLFFHTDEDLFEGTYSDGITPVDPLNFWNNEGTGTSAPSPGATPKPTAKENLLYVDANKQRVHFDLAVRDSTDKRMTADSGLVKFADSSRGNDYYYFENTSSADNRVILGTLSFRVNETIVSGSTTIEDLEQKLKDMVDKFNGLDWKYDKEGSVDPSKDATGDKEYLFRESREENVKRQVKYLKKSGTASRPNYQSTTEDHAIGIQISIEADDVIQDAWPVKEDITINAYQAYTNGNIDDLAIAMQNYADSVRVKRVSGKESDMSIYWGDPVDNPTSANMPADGPGMIVRKAKLDGGKWVEDTASPRYRFKWDSTGYTLEEDAGSGFTPITSADVYGHGKLFDPRGNYLGDDQYGHYIIKQYFTYWERTGTGGSGDFALKTFPKPIQVTLHVTPINIIDATVEKQQITYRNDIDEVPQTFTKLDLADEAKLIMDVTLSGVTPTMPVSWTPANSPAWVAGTLDGNVVGVAGNGNPNYTVPAPGNTANWPIGAAAINAKTGVGDYTFTTQVLEVDIQTKYPWATTNGDYDPLNSYRRIVNVEPASPGEPNAQLPRYVMWAQPYEVAPAGAVAGVTAGDPVARLRVTIARQEATWNATTEEWDWNYVNMDPVGGVDYQFKLYMPNDQRIMADAAGVNWFGPSNSTYLLQRRVGLTDGSLGITNLNVYQINISPGDLGATDTYAASRETLRQYINLGGWFGAEILEPNATVWNDKISAFSKPRTNIYTMSYILDPAAVPTPVPAGTETWLFDYTGSRAGLMPFYENSDLPTYITLPADEAVEVRYDALTGSQPGRMRQFKVEAAPGTTPERWQHIEGNDTGPVPPDSPPWATPVPAASPSPAVPGEIVTYGEDLFERSYEYSGFGTVTNPNTSTITGYPVELQDRKAKIKVEVQDPLPLPSDDPANWELTLTYEQTGDNITEYTDGQVKRVTFDNKMEGYTYQQVVTLTVTNTGNRDIRGLYIDIPNTPKGPCFRLVTPPPTSLAVGASATFQLSYIQGLTEGDYQDIFTTEPIHIWHDNSGPADDGKAPETLPGQVDEGFEAVLKVTKTRPYRVTVVVHPNLDETGTIVKPMGDGWLVEGITTDSGTDSYSGVLGANVYEMNKRFWVLTQPEDEYSLITMNDGGTPRVWVYYIRDDDATKTRVYLNEYNAGGPNAGFGVADDSFVTQDNPERLFWGEMPDGSVTVHVHYYEPLLSKLRLSDLHAYAWDQQSEAVLKPAPIPAAAWEENPASTALFDSLSYERPLNVHNSDGTYSEILFKPEEDEYIVFLEPSVSGKDNFCGVSIALRDLVTHINGIGDTDTPVQENNVDIYPSVRMILDDAPGTIVCDDSPGITVPPPSTDGPTTHHSAAFNAPLDNDAATSIAQTTVTINISYDGTTLIPPEGYESRTYKVRFVRRMEDGKAKHIALPGNSPYGMIENDSTITDKAGAKATFDVNNRFDFSNTAHTPHQATELKNVYWPEAWEGGVNYDKDVTALFVYAGQEFYDSGVKNIYNNAGDYIDGIEVSRSLEYVKLDTTQTTPWDRFSGTATGVIDLGAVPAVNGEIPGDTITLATGGVSASYDGMVDALVSMDDIRPGIYQLKYTYKDYDGSTDIYFTRPLIVLTPNGDVDADKTVTDVDRVSIQQRFNQDKALPYELATTVYSEADELVYKYRVVDANNDRNINNIDAGMIRKVTTLLPTAKLTEFYRPTEYTYPVKPTP